MLLGKRNRTFRLAVVVRRFHRDEIGVGRDEHRVVRVAHGEADIRRDVLHFI